MAKLLWDQVGTRRYQTGVDRGVLYPSSGDGVAWNGLTAVREAATGGEPQPFFVDGYKYAHRPAREDFQGSIDAFTYPLEFEECDGSKNLGRGLILTQQRRKSFGLSYRTKVGNDLDGPEHGYRLHIAYNLLASPAARAYETMSDKTDPVAFSWSFSSRAIRVTGYRAVPHIVIDSTASSVSLMSAIEDILYGSATAAPRLPLPSEIITLFGAWPEMVVTDNGDGTYTVSGPDNVVSLLNGDIFQIVSPSATDNGDGTFTVS